jgi:parallel beta-helix repeat protein
MRIILTILFLFSVAYGQTNYYVSNAGNDSNDGLTTTTAWQTLSKVNASTFNAGDSILLKRGDSWNEKLTLTSSGSAGSPIVVSAYGSGVKPLVTGFQTLTGFVNTSGNIWTVTASNSVPSLNTVLVDGKIQAKGRYPNASGVNGGYLTYQTATQTSLTSSSLTGAPNYTGKECVVRTAAWILDVVKVASQSTSTLNFSQLLTYNAGTLGGSGFFFQNDSTFLDVQGEWSFDSATKRLQVYSISSPTVQISTIDTLIYVNGHHYITFDNLSITGANKAAFQFDSLSNITVQNSSINNSGNIALSAQKSSDLSIINDSVQNSLSNGIFFKSIYYNNLMIDTCNYPVISNNYIKNTGIYAGMGMSNNGRYVGVYVIGHKPNISNNQIDSTGYNSLMFNGDTSLIEKNYVSNFCFVKDDGAGIYTVVGTYIPADYNNGSIIRKNIVVNGVGAPQGKSFRAEAYGIYLDNGIKNIAIDSNAIYNATFGGLYLHEADSNTVRVNNVFNTVGNGFYYNGDNSLISAGGNQIKNNAFYSSSPSWYNILRSSGTNLGNIDSNYYSRPSDTLTNFSLNGVNYALAGWKSASGKDLNSVGTPLGIVSSSATIVYNPTQNDSTISFTNRKMSIRNVRYNSITLAPFASAILFDEIITIAPRQYQYKHYQ